MIQVKKHPVRHAALYLLAFFFLVSCTNPWMDSIVDKLLKEDKPGGGPSNGGTSFISIGSASDLENKLNANLSGDFVLVNNITINGTWTPIGPFTGIFDGNGKTITMNNCNITGNVGGIFDLAGNSVVIKNLCLNGSITVNATNHAAAGSVTGTNTGLIENVSSSVTVTFNSPGSNYFTMAGGIVGVNQGTIRNCYSTGDITTINGTSTGWWFTGGIVGVNGRNAGSGQILNCWASGAINALTGTVSPDAGGICGRSDSDTPSKVIENCVALNSSVSVKSGGSLGRVCSNDTGYLTNNWALDSMTLSSGAATSSASGKDGANVTAADANTLTWWTSTAGWTINTTGGSESSPWKWDSANNRPILWFETTVNH